MPLTISEWVGILASGFFKKAEKRIMACSLLGAGGGRFWRLAACGWEGVPFDGLAFFFILHFVETV